METQPKTVAFQRYGRWLRENISNKQQPQSLLWAGLNLKDESEISGADSGSILPRITLTGSVLTD